MLNTINYPNNINDSLQELDNDAWINTTNKWDNNNNIHIIPLVSGEWKRKIREKLLHRTILKTKES